MNGANKLLVPQNVELFYNENIHWPFGKECDAQFVGSVLAFEIPSLSLLLHRVCCRVTQLLGPKHVGAFLVL